MLVAHSMRHCCILYAKACRNRCLVFHCLLSSNRRASHLRRAPLSVILQSLRHLAWRSYHRYRCAYWPISSCRARLTIHSSRRRFAARLNSGVRLMNPTMLTSKTPPPPRILARMIIAASYSIFNAGCLLLNFREFTIIRSDGPNGFAEFIIKALIVNLSIASFVAAIFLTRSIYRAANIRYPLIIMSIAISLPAAFFATLSIIDACSDNKGHCRNWQVVSSAPNNSFKPTLLRNAA